VVARPVPRVALAVRVEVEQCPTNITVNLIPPATLYGPRRNNFDLRLSKLQRFSSRRLTISVDGYNLTNSDTVLAFNNSFVPGGAWLTPTRIAAPRYMKVGAQFDF
jgi:hypothetical protein